jgi:opacity protein-like surface antigen
LQQAYVQFRIPVGNGLDVKFGKFVTLLSNEVIDAPANWNYSRSYLFAYAVPFTHTGALMSYRFNDIVDAQFAVVNGWDNVEDNNSGKTLMGRVGVTLLGGKLVFATMGIGGPEQNSDNRNYRWVVDEVITWNATEKLSFAFEALYGSESIPDDPASLGYTVRDNYEWWGAALYAKYKLTPHLSAAARAEYFSDVGGSRLGGIVGVNTLRGPGEENTVDVQEYTLTFALENVWKNLTPRLEFRYDHLNAPVFTAEQTHSVFTASLDLIYVF